MPILSQKCCVDALFSEIEEKHVTGQKIINLKVSQKGQKSNLK